MALSSGQLALADKAITKVEAAVVQGQAAIDGESTFLTWITDSESARNARIGNLDASKKALNQLKAKRPGLETQADLDGFLKLAGIAGDMTELLADAHRMTGAGFKEEVVDPSLKTLSFGLGSGAGLAGRAAGAFAAYKLLGRSVHPLLALAAGWIVAGLVVDAVLPDALKGTP